MTITPIDEMYRCDNCSFETKSIPGLSRHVKNKHGLILSTSKNTCSLCKKVFASSASCVRHITTKVCIPITEEIEETKETKETKEIEETKETKEFVEKVCSTTELISTNTYTDETVSPVIEVCQIIPYSIEGSNTIKNSSSIVSTLVKVAMCSVFLIPFLSKIKKI